MCFKPVFKLLFGIKEKNRLNPLGPYLILVWNLLFQILTILWQKPIRPFLTMR
jgi:hypothetical protein